VQGPGFGPQLRKKKRKKKPGPAVFMPALPALGVWRQGSLGLAAGQPS